MRGRAPLLLNLLLLFLAFLEIPTASAPHDSAQSSTLVGGIGEYRDIEVDAAHGRLFVTDAINFGETRDQGIVSFDLATHAQVARVPLHGPTGMALSPSGALLAVGTSEGYLYLIDANTLEIVSSGHFYDEEWTSAYFWDLAFNGEEHLVASLGTYWVTCEGSVMIVNLVTMGEEARLTDSPCGIFPFSGVRVDAVRQRLYVLMDGEASAYDLSQMPPRRTVNARDGGFTPNAALTADGARLFFSSGKVFDALTLSPFADAGTTGDVALEDATGYAFYGRYGRIDRVNVSDYALAGRFRTRFTPANGPRTLNTIALDPPRALAYMMIPEGGNANELHALPLFAAFLDPYPPDGNVVPDSVSWTSVVASGDFDTSTLTMEVDGRPVAFVYDPLEALIYEGTDPPWTGGSHRISVSGRETSGALHTLAWTFTVDSTPPRILVDIPADGYPDRLAVIRGHIVDESSVVATANGAPLAVDEVTGAFVFSLELREDPTRLVIFAQDQVGHQTSEGFLIWFVPRASPILLGGITAFGITMAACVVLFLRHIGRKGYPPPTE